MKILLVDDDPEILYIARYALEKGGHDVLSATTGVEAMTLARAEGLDVIVTDVVLPDMEAWDLLTRLRRGPAPATPIVLLTARQTPSEASHPGVVGVIEKPFDPLALETEIARLAGPL